MDATTTVTAPEPAAGRGLSSQWQPVAYWLATAAVAGEMGLGGSWDVARLDVVKTLVTRLGYPTYVLCCSASGRSWARSFSSFRAAQS